MYILYINIHILYTYKHKYTYIHTNMGLHNVIAIYTELTGVKSWSAKPDKWKHTLSGDQTFQQSPVEENTEWQEEPCGPSALLEYHLLFSQPTVANVIKVNSESLPASGILEWVKYFFFNQKDGLLSEWCKNTHGGLFMCLSPWWPDVFSASCQCCNIKTSWPGLQASVGGYGSRGVWGVWICWNTVPIRCSDIRSEVQQKILLLTYYFSQAIYKVSIIFCMLCCFCYFMTLYIIVWYLCCLRSHHFI